MEGAEVKHDNSFLKVQPKNIKIRYFQCKSTFYLHAAFYELKFTSLEIKLLPNNMLLQSYFLFPVLNRKTIFHLPFTHLLLFFRLLLALSKIFVFNHGQITKGGK